MTTAWVGSVSSSVRPQADRTSGRDLTRRLLLLLSEVGPYPVLQGLRAGLVRATLARSTSTVGKAHRRAASPP